MKKGWYEQAGLSINFKFPQGAAVPAHLVGVGRVQIAATYEPDILATRAAGLGIKTLMTVFDRIPGGVEFYRDSGIRKPKDLEGRTIAVYDYPGSKYNFKVFFEKNGVDASKVKIVSAGADSAKLLIAGKVDAIDGAPALEGLKASLATKKPIGNFFFDQRFGFPKTYYMLLAVNEKWLQQNQDAARKFVEVTQRAIAWSASHQKEALGIYLKEYPNAVTATLATKGFAALKQSWCGNSALCWAPHKPIGLIDPSVWKGYAAFLARGGLVTRKAAADLSALTRNKYLSKKYLTP